MGCLSDFGINFGNNNKYSHLNQLEELKQQHANQIVEKLRPKINEYIQKRDSQTPRVIAQGNYCNNPCYEFNLNLFKTCPKCKGAVVEDYENEYTIINTMDDYNRIYEKKIYKKDTCCTNFVFDEKLISKEDCHSGVLIQFFERQEEVDGKKNYYMMLDGEKYDFGNLSFLNVFAGQQGKALFPEKNGVEEVLLIYRVGKPVTYSNLQNGQRVPLVCLYRCGKCGFKYHIMQTSPFMFRDKSKDLPK